MSIKLMSKIWDMAEPGGSKLLLLLALADMANDEGYCWPSYRTLAKKIRVGEHQTIMLMRELQEEGWVKKEKRVRNNDPMDQTSNGYWLKIPESKGGVTCASPGGLCADNPGGLCADNPNHHIEPSFEPFEIESASISSPAENLEELPFVDPPAKKKTRKEKPLQEEKAGPENQVMFGQIVELCQLDARVMAGRIGKTVKQLRLANYGPDDLFLFGPWWAANDWRGQKGQPPTLQQVIENIARSKGAGAAAGDPVERISQDDFYQVYPRSGGRR